MSQDPLTRHVELVETLPHVNVMNWEHIRHMENQRAIREQTQAIREQTHAIRQEGASMRHPENYMDRVVKGEW